MKITRLLMKITVFASVSTAIIFANSNMRGSLKTGDVKILVPKDDYALSITRTPGMISSRSSYDFIMLNNKDIVYEDKNQVDDIHLVFHDDVHEGDLIKIRINHGFFDYKIAPINALPNIVKSALDKEVVKRASIKKEREKTRKKKAVSTPKSFKKEEVHEVVNVPKIISPTVEYNVAETIPVEADVVANSVAITSDKPRITTNPASPISDNFFAKFTKIFENLVKSFKADKSAKKEVLTETEETKKIMKAQKVEPRGIIKRFDDSALLRSATQKEMGFVPQEKGIQTTFDDSSLQNKAQLEDRAFKEFVRGITPTFDDTQLQSQAQTSTKVFNKPQEIVVNKYIPTTTEQTYSGAGSREEKEYHEQFSKMTEAVPNFKGRAPVVAEVPTVMSHSVTAPSIEKPRVQPVATNNEPYYPDTGYKEGYQSLDNDPKNALVTQPTSKVVQTPVVVDRTLPTNNVISEDTEDKQLVITKIIKKEETDPYAGRVMGKMSDRVLGNGYDVTEHTGKLGMKVTKNAKPISAWVEVFKDGTKERVKTFYTSKGRSVKSVTLPAGTYMVKATYRTRDSKQQKTIKNIRIKEGASINRAISFHDGKLRVIARRGDKPLYVKVVVYKSGTRNRVTYDFSSRTSGIAELSLSSGLYDVEVLEHDNDLPYQSIKITGGKTNTIHADF